MLQTTTRQDKRRMQDCQKGSNNALNTNKAMQKQGKDTKQDITITTLEMEIMPHNIQESFQEVMWLINMFLFLFLRQPTSIG